MLPSSCCPSFLSGNTPPPPHTPSLPISDQPSSSPHPPSSSSSLASSSWRTILRGGNRGNPLKSMPLVPHVGIYPTAGRSIFFTEVGLMSRRTPVNVVVGSPIAPPKRTDFSSVPFSPKYGHDGVAQNADVKLLDGYHEQYVQSFVVACWGATDLVSVATCRGMHWTSGLVPLLGPPRCTSTSRGVEVTQEHTEKLYGRDDLFLRFKIIKWGFQQLFDGTFCVLAMLFLAKQIGRLVGSAGLRAFTF